MQNETVVHATVMSAKIAHRKLTFISMVVTEIVNYTSSHACRGDIIIDVTENNQDIALKIEDRGTRISNLSLVIGNGFSMIKNLGLSAVRQPLKGFSVKILDRTTSVTTATYLFVSRQLKG